MAGGGLFDPLGTDRPAGASRAGPSLWLVALVVVLIGMAGLFGTAAIRNGGAAGEPRVVAAIGAVHPIDPAPASPPIGSPDATTQARFGQNGTTGTSDQDIVVENGVRVIRPRRNGSPGASLVMKVPEVASAAAALPAEEGLLEPGPSGLLPRVGSDGKRPAEVYAGAPVPGSAGKPMVSIVVSNLGRDSGGPVQVPMNWPAGVTLGFAVDGTDLARHVASARAAGHEVVLILPHPAAEASASVSSPGTTSASSSRERLLWQLSRFTGYAGVILDGTTGDAATTATDTLEITRRGLYVVDAFPAHRTAIPTSSTHVAGVPVPAADAMLMESPGSDSSDRFLERLASLARSEGTAIGIAPASSRTLAAISRFAASLADTGVALVPLGAVVSFRQSAQARPIPVAAP